VSDVVMRGASGFSFHFEDRTMGKLRAGTGGQRDRRNRCNRFEDRTMGKLRAGTGGHA
jgi:hypothetical protein